MPLVAFCGLTVEFGGCRRQVRWNERLGVNLPGIVRTVSASAPRTGMRMIGRPMSEQLIEELAGNRVRNVAHHKTGQQIEGR